MATKGSLRLTIIEAVLERDVGTADDLIMDPYVVVRNGQFSARTNALEDAGKTPVWNETIELSIERMNEDVALRVMDENIGANC